MYGEILVAMIQENALYQGQLVSDAPNSMGVVNENLDSRVVDRNSTTAFVEDAGVVKSATRSRLDVASIGPPQFHENSIAEFLAKPVAIKNGTFSSANVRNSNLETFSIETELFANTMWLNKLEGYNLIRATAVVRLVINAQPFQAGRLLMHFLPCASEFAAVNNTYELVHNWDLTQKTQHPCVELDLRHTACELEIPYVTPTSYYDLSRAGYDWGTVYVDVLSPIRTGASGVDSVQYTIFMSFRDLELSAPIAPQSGVAEYDGKMGTKSGVKKAVKPRMVRSMDKEEKETRQGGWLSKSLDTAGDVATAVSAIPSWAPLAVPGAAIAHGLAAVARWFGWAKPLNDSIAQLMLLHPAHNIQNFDGSNTADNLALDSKCKVRPFQGVFGSEVDEMSFAYLKSIPAYVTYFQVSSSLVPGTVVYEQEITPFELCSSIAFGPGGSNVRSFPPAFHLARLFQYWRGSVNVTLKPIKTEYHSLRLVVTFTPSNDILNPTLSTSSYSMREIIDIRAGEEFTYNLPYMKYANFLDVTGTSSTRSGKLAITVLNELRAPETADQTIEFLVYYSGGDDFQYGGYLPAYASNFVPQSGPGIIGDALSPDTSLVHNYASLGDPFLSIKQLLNVPSRVFTPNATNSQFLGISPFAFGVVGVDPITNDHKLPAVFDILSFLAEGYAFHRGGVRILFPSNSETHQNFLLRRLDNNTAFLFDATGYISQYTSTPVQVQRMNLGSIRSYNTDLVDIVTPYLGNTPIRLNYLHSQSQDITELDLVDSFPYFVLTQSSSNVPLRDIRRGASDDFALGYFIGFGPQLFTYNTI